MKLSKIVIFSLVSMIGVMFILGTPFRMPIQGTIIKETGKVPVAITKLLLYTAKVTIFRVNFIGINEKVKQGSSVAIASDGTFTYYLTNKHMVMELIESPNDMFVSLTFSDKSVVPAECLHISLQHDLAVLKVVGIHPTIKLAPKVPSIGDLITVIGAPYGVYPVVTTGLISQHREQVLTEQNVLMLSVGGAPGSSGSPVFNEKGELIGLVFAGVREVPFVLYSLGYETLFEFFSELERTSPAVFKKLVPKEITRSFEGFAPNLADKWGALSNLRLMFGTIITLPYEQPEVVKLRLF